MSGRAFVVDRVVTAPGCGREFVEKYTTAYVPGGRSRGMTLEHILVSPPIWQGETSNVVTIVWSLDDVAGWWNMTRLGRPDATLAQWWDSVHELIVERSRSMAGEVADVEELCNV